MDKVTIAKFVAANSDRITYEHYKGGTSGAWTDYVKVYVDNEFCQFIKCVHCSTLLKWKHRDGTSGLINHTKSCAKNKTLTATDRKLTDVGAVLIQPKQQQSQRLPASVKNEVADAVVMMCATDIRYVGVMLGMIM